MFNSTRMINNGIWGTRLAVWQFWGFWRRYHQYDGYPNRDISQSWAYLHVSWLCVVWIPAQFPVQSKYNFISPAESDDLGRNHEMVCEVFCLLVLSSLVYLWEHVLSGRTSRQEMKQFWRWPRQLALNQLIRREMFYPSGVFIYYCRVVCYIAFLMICRWFYNACQFKLLVFIGSVQIEHPKDKRKSEHSIRDIRHICWFP